MAYAIYNITGFSEEEYKKSLTFASLCKPHKVGQLEDKTSYDIKYYVLVFSNPYAA